MQLGHIIFFLREDVPPDHKLRQRSRPSANNPVTSQSDISDPSASAVVAQVGVLSTQRQPPPDHSPSPSPSVSSLTSSSGSTVVLDEANSDG